MSTSARNNTLFAALLGTSLALGACGSDEEPVSDTGTDAGADVGGSDTGSDVTDGPCANAPATVTVNADITEDTTWCAASEIVIEDLTFVTGATLTIEAGTTVMGTDGAALVIANDAMINAVGTADAPIVFTSTFGDQAEAGDWGGLVLLGKASINVGTSNIEGMDASSASAYGGTDDTHNCGTLRYVRIEYGGFVFGEDNELNGLTVGGCGSDTTLEYIQVHKGLDDGVEFFGGTASIKWAVVSQTDDDGFDWDEGWRGNAQFLVVQQSGSVGDKGFESDNLGDDNDAAPRSNPTIYNVTMVSPGTNADQTGMHIRRGTAATIANVIIAGFDGEAVDIDGAVTAGLWGTDLTFSHVINVANGDWADETGDDDDDAGFDEAAMFAAIPGYKTDDPMLGDWQSLTAPNFVPAADGSATGGAATPGGWFSDAAYYGAFEPGGNDWTTGWTAFP